ncbi:MAG: hypothetical protein ACXWQR_12940 [Ktedonobacterales bacterium]
MRRWRWDGTTVGLVVVTLLIVIVVGWSDFRRDIPTATETPSAGDGACGYPPTTNCTITVEWITLKSQSPADVLAAVHQSQHFNHQCAEQDDCLHDLSRLGTPQLVRAILSSHMNNMPDCYVIPVLDASHNTVGVAVAKLNASHTALTVADIVTYPQPRPNNGTIARIQPDAAVEAVVKQHHTTLRANVQPQLVYFPFDFAGEKAGTVTWNGGGQFPYDPLWLIQGMDGRDHVVGDDGRAYYLQELPVAP